MSVELSGGLVVGRGAVAVVWPPACAWFAARRWTRVAGAWRRDCGWFSWLAG